MTAELRFLLGQVLGILATVITVISYQMNTKRSLLLVQTTATACTCLAYLFLDAASGFALNIVCIMRNVVFYCQKERKPVNIPAVLLALAMVGVGFLSWQGPVSLLIIAALAANTLFMSVGDPQLLRKSVLVTSTMILLYNILVFSLGGIANEGLSVISSAVGIVRFRREKTEK
ncbi:MAG: YgjV family protein [Oscillospiraceae bacterium]|nr:YgjV family protein [Oscillospiraceae bacterium]